MPHVYRHAITRIISPQVQLRGMPLEQRGKLFYEPDGFSGSNYEGPKPLGGVANSRVKMVAQPLETLASLVIAIILGLFVVAVFIQVTFPAVVSDEPKQPVTRKHDAPGAEFLFRLTEGASVTTPWTGALGRDSDKSKIAAVERTITLDAELLDRAMRGEMRGNVRANTFPIETRRSRSLFGHYPGFCGRRIHDP